MPVEPPQTPYGQRLRGRTEPLAPNDDQYGWAHWILCESIGAIFLELQQAFDPEDMPPVASLLDVDTCPDWALPWLAQFVGVQIPVGVAPDDARELIRAVSGFSRGTPAALQAAAALFLTGNQSVFFREREGSAYHLEIVTRESETPDPDAVLRALLSQKPGGLTLDYHTVRGWDYEELTLHGPDPYSALAAAFATYRDLQNG
jgi:hypothetical protein